MDQRRNSALRIARAHDAAHDRNAGGARRPARGGVRDTDSVGNTGLKVA
jgi:hypothetical protein